MVNDLRARDKIIVADWHYQPSRCGEFPSVDYFQGLGFKDVWGCPWFNDTNLRQFSRYAATRHCGGMQATAWNRAYSPDGDLSLHTILCNSAAYFHKPSIDPLQMAATVYQIAGSHGRSLADEKRTGIAVRDDMVLSFRAPVREAITPRDGLLTLSTMRREGKAVRQPLTFDTRTRELHATLELPADTPAGEVLQVMFGYTDAATGYFYSKSGHQGLVVADRSPQLPSAGPNVLLVGDFQALADPRLKSPLWLGGQCAGPLGVALARKPSGEPRAEALDVQWFDRLWVFPSEYLNETLACGMRIEIEAKLTGQPQGDLVALLTKGSYSTGFRVLVRNDGRLLFQLAKLDEGRPLAVVSKSVLPRNQWVRIELAYRPPDEQTPGEASIRFADRDEGRQPVLVPMPPSKAVIGIGCEFGDPTMGPTGKLRPNFPGLLRRVTIFQEPRP
jgi:hypothetical protein